MQCKRMQNMLLPKHVGSCPDMLEAYSPQDLGLPSAEDCLTSSQNLRRCPTGAE